ncbi:CHAT domain-containing protein [Lactarius psammicola]|nr:CHAT domain-containing protein [Lactarius psammicola]
MALLDLPAKLMHSSPFRKLLSLCLLLFSVFVFDIPSLVIKRLKRHTPSNQRGGLYEAVLHLTKSILLRPRSWLEHGSIILKALFLPALALFTRSIPSKLLKVTTYAAKYLFLSAVFVFDIRSLAIKRLKRYTPSIQRGGLYETVRLTKSILRPRSWLEHGPIILQALSPPTPMPFTRPILSMLLKVAIYAAKYLRHLRDQPHETFGLSRDRVTLLLVNVLALQVMYEARNLTQNIGEMAVLCHELLTLDLSDDVATRTITTFAVLVQSKISVLVPGQPLDQVIECLRAARKSKLNLREARLPLAFSLGHRYAMTFEDDDYEEAASVLDEVITSSSPGDSRGEYVAARQYMAAMAGIRSTEYKIPESSEETISRTGAALGSSQIENPLHSIFNYLLKRSAKQRSHYFGSIGGSGGLGVSNQDSSSQLLTAIEKSGLDTDPEFGRYIENMKRLREVFPEIRSNDVTRIDKAIEKGRSIVFSRALASESSRFELFSEMLFEAFERTKNIKYLNESISTLRQDCERSSGRILPYTKIRRLIRSLAWRAASSKGHLDERDLDESLELISQCINDGHASLPDRFGLACAWASIARRAKHRSVSTAYETAMSLMRDTLLFAPTVQLQHVTLATSDNSGMPLDYASYQVGLRQLEAAIETLERGRALLWSEMRLLRAPIDQLLQAHPQLGHKFAAVNQDLEDLTKSIPPSLKLSMDDGVADDLRVVDPFGRLLLKQRGLLKERDNLISQIQALPGFDSFMTFPLFDTLRSAASSGPVIIINHSKWRSDILILLHNTSPSLIRTPADFYRRAERLKTKLLASRNKYGLDSNDYDQTLAIVLTRLYKLVGKPVIDRLRLLGVPEQSRIWWCPTSVFCSLPLHAMGPIPSDDDEKRYFLDLYICSYTPTLSALIKSRNRDLGSRSSDRPSLLLVAQPDPSLPTVGGEIQVIQALDTKVTSLISEAATPATVIDSFRHHQFIHFACHGTLKAGKPFEAGFKLYGSERLTLLDIVRSDLPTAEFAFLSACHTAEVTEGSIVDESLHLAAAVQFCGFRSVVGTMWAMADEDGRDLAEHFYKTLFSSKREQGIPYHERSAKALRFAVKKLRRKRRMTLERWVNFVHYGA